MVTALPALVLFLSGAHCRITKGPPEFSAIFSVVYTFNCSTLSIVNVNTLSLVSAIMRLWFIRDTWRYV